MRIAIFNNYPLERVLDEVRLKESPDHLLFGLNFLQSAGHKCEVIKENQSTLPLFVMLKVIFPFVHWGDLKKQSFLYKYKKNYDLIYSCCGNMTNALQFLKSFKKFNLPIINIQHHPVIPGRIDFLRHYFEKRICNYADQILCLSQNVKKSIEQKYKSVHNIRSIQWGPDIKFYPKTINPGKGLVVAGRTSRDFSTVINSINQTDLNATIIYLENQLGYDHYVHSNIKLISAKNEQPVPGVTNKGWIKQCDLNYYYQNARVIGIPTTKQNTLVGLTSLLDCIGIGKPIIMTKNPNIDIDIEKEGIGHWVKPGDTKRWRNLIKWYDENPDKALQMGIKARYLGQRKYNSEVFSQKILDILIDELSKVTNK